MAQKERTFIQDLPKYFMHGLFYAIIGTLATLMFAVIVLIETIIVGAIAVAAGELVGYVVLVLFFVVLLVLVFFVAGLINAVLSRSFWNATPPGGFKSYTGHGTVLIILLVIFGLPNMAIDWLFPNLDLVTFLIVAVPRIVIYSIIDGYVGRWLAYGFSNFAEATKSVATEEGIVGTCPQCGVDMLVKIRAESAEKVVVCQGCNVPFEIPRPNQ
ncbi:MAG: hypothetical protein ACFFEW_09835 [Candidatus Thorarchaeota archaeon]